MPILFLDTSALIKLYVAEIGSNWLRHYVNGQQIAISELAFFEVANALRRRYTEGTYTRDEATDLFGQIEKGSTDYEIVALGGQLQLNRVLTLLFSLPGGQRLRTLDSLHLAAAEQVQEDASQLTPPQPLVFLSSDIQLLRAAQLLGLTTENPESHP
ncbi:MAG TPA: type II toxin-antitoxin system VapC family toxin [Chloroflexia bacterium]|nr:type II toxin-antitoxin system VapC family toxin [Chloroflexia bacterium]